jgi:hypothetical protein
MCELNYLWVGVRSKDAGVGGASPSAFPLWGLRAALRLVDDKNSGCLTL